MLLVVSVRSCPGPKPRGTRWWAPTCRPRACGLQLPLGTRKAVLPRLQLGDCQPLSASPVVRVPEAALHVLSCDDRVASWDCGFPHPEES